MKRMVFSVLMIMGLLLGGGKSAMAVMIGFDPTSPFLVTGGDTVSVDITISDRGAEIVSAYDLDVAYDSAVLDATAVTFGTFLGGPFLSWQDVNFLPGIVDLAEISLLSDAELNADQPDDFVLATIDFNVLGDGEFVTDLEFLWTAGNDVKGRRNQVIIPSVPEPGSFALLAAGLAAFGMRRKYHVSA